MFKWGLKQSEKSSCNRGIRPSGNLRERTPGKILIVLITLRHPPVSLKMATKKTLQDLKSWDEGIFFEIKTTLKRSQIRDYYRNYHRNCYRKFNSDQQLGYSFEKVISCGYLVVESIIIGNITGIIRGNIIGFIIGIIIGNWSHSEEISADHKLRDGN